MVKKGIVSRPMKIMDLVVMIVDNLFYRPWVNKLVF